MLEIREFAPDDEKFLRIVNRGEEQDVAVRDRVEAIIQAVRERGDAALCEFSARFDGVELKPDKLRVSDAEFDAARSLVSEEFVCAVTLARVNIRKFHEYQRRGS